MGHISFSTALPWVAAAVIVATLSSQRPWLVANATPSEPRGLYVGVPASPAVGRLVAFQAPAAALPYAGGLPLLKTVAAGPGDLVCASSGRLAINRVDRGPIARVDHQGRPLPQWSGCRPMRPDELFVFSDRVPNSFDSRYFGPVPRNQVLGVYVRVPLISEQP
ncbi:MAG: S26 family signal peptidase [Caulobacteraceae bacterium]|nr:S26 family signal peptidase [Caulobacteraceae bacterium]